MWSVHSLSGQGTDASCLLRQQCTQLRNRSHLRFYPDGILNACVARGTCPSRDRQTKSASGRNRMVDHTIWDLTSRFTNALDLDGLLQLPDRMSTSKSLCLYRHRRI
jgi:hypothetical protein